MNPGIDGLIEAAVELMADLLMGVPAPLERSAGIMG